MANVKTPLKEIFIMFEPWQLAAKDDVAVEVLIKQFNLD